MGQIIEYLRNTRGLELTISGDYFGIPDNGPVMAISNHPLGAIDGAIIGYIMESRNSSNFKIVTDTPDEVLTEISDINIFRGNTPEERKLPPKKMIQTLTDGGTLGIFPAGKSSHRDILTGITQETQWERGALTIAKRTKATIIPIHIKAHPNLVTDIGRAFFPGNRGSLNIPQSIALDQSVHVTIGSPITNSNDHTIDSIQREIYQIGNEDYQV